MVNEKTLIKIIILFAFVFTLIVIAKQVSACHLAGQTVYSNCNESAACTSKSDCGYGTSKDVYDWYADLGGCEIGIYAGQWINPSCEPDLIYGGTCNCPSKEAKWLTTSSAKEGSICKIRAGQGCDNCFPGCKSSDGRWDTDGGFCVVCDSHHVETKRATCSNGGISKSDGDNLCERACGASKACDEYSPSTEFCSGNLKVDCDANCQNTTTDCSKDICSTHVLETGGSCKHRGRDTAYCSYSINDCNSNTHTCGESKKCGGTIYWCVYDSSNGWHWDTSKPSNFCCSNKDCSGSGCCDGVCNMINYRCQRSPNSTKCSSGQFCDENCQCESCKTKGEACSATSPCCDNYTSGDTCYYNGKCEDKYHTGDYSCYFSSCSLYSCGTNYIVKNEKCTSSGCTDGDTYTCNSNTHTCDESEKCGGTTYYCVYDSSNGWYWATSEPSNFCCNDTYCSGYDSSTHTALKCNCPSGTSGCSIHDSSKPYYTCQPLKSCKKNSDCDSGYCCTADPAIASEDRESPGHCSVSKDNPIYKSKYLCDPPGWKVSSETTTKRLQKTGNTAPNINLINLPFYFLFKIFS